MEQEALESTWLVMTEHSLTRLMGGALTTRGISSRGGVCQERCHAYEDALLSGDSPLLNVKVRQALGCNLWKYIFVTTFCVFATLDHLYQC